MYIQLKVVLPKHNSKQLNSQFIAKPLRQKHVSYVRVMSSS